MIDSARMAAVDRNAEALGVPRKQLMESSGGAVAREVQAVAEPGESDADAGASVAVVAGRGNNGGDAFVAARFLDGAGLRPASDQSAPRSGREYDLTVHLLGRRETISTEIARENWDALQQAEYDTRTVTDSRDLDLGEPDVVVDGLLGTGVTGALREPERSAAAAINALDATVVAVDVPSGVDADTGEAAGVAVEADRVVTFHDAKPGLAGRDDVTVADIGIPAAAETFVGPGDLLDVRRAVERPDARVFVIGGGPYTGAPALAAQAALRAGATLSFIAAPETVADEIQGYAEDLIVQPYEGDRLTPDQVPDLVETAHDYDDVVVLGPGLGSADDTLAAARQFLESFEGRAVVDADALPVVSGVDTDATLVCTPNRRELARMGGPEVEGSLRNALGEIEAFAADLGHVVLAKAAEDAISDGDRTRVCRAGTPGMSVGGTGDTLAGVVAARLASQEPLQAAAIGSYANGRAAELQPEKSSGLLASDLLDTLPEALWGDDDD